MKILKISLNTIMLILLFLLIATSMFINSGKTLISTDNISKFITEANILNVDINVLFNQDESGITLKEKITTLALENEIPEKIVVDILNSEEINQLLGDFFNQTITYIIKGTEKPQISQKSIDSIKETANDSLNNHLNIMLEEEQLDNYIDNFCDDIIKIVPERNDIIGSYKIDTLQKLFEFNINYLYLIIILILFLSILVNKKWYYFIKILGVTMFLSGILFVILGSSEYVIYNVIFSKINIMIPFILPLITNVLTISFKRGVLISFSSVVLMLIYLTINKMHSK